MKKNVNYSPQFIYMLVPNWSEFFNFMSNGEIKVKVNLRRLIIGSGFRDMNMLQLDILEVDQQSGILYSADCLFTEFQGSIGDRGFVDILILKATASVSYMFASWQYKIGILVHIFYNLKATITTTNYMNRHQFFRTMKKEEHITCSNGEMCGPIILQEISIQKQVKRTKNLERLLSSCSCCLKDNLWAFELCIETIKSTGIDSFLKLQGLWSTIYQTQSSSVVY